MQYLKNTNEFCYIYYTYVEIFRIKKLIVEPEIFNMDMQHGQFDNINVELHVKFIYKS